MPRLLAPLIALACLLTVAPARATYVVTEDHGGIIQQFLDRYETLRASRDRVIIDGPCESACTLMLGIVPRSRICVTPRASLGFHSASQIWTEPDATGRAVIRSKYSAAGTRLMWRTYPRDVRAALTARGWRGDSPHPDLIVIRGPPLRRLIRPCED